MQENIPYIDPISYEDNLSCSKDEGTRRVSIQNAKAQVDHSNAQVNISNHHLFV